MKKKLFSLLVSAVMLSTVFSGCGGGSAQTSTGEKTENTQTAEKAAENSVIDAGAGENATELDYWTFVELHGQHFEKMLQKWNEENPDRQIKLNVTVMPYDDMHNKLLIAVQTGEGAPDISDIELGRFPDFLSADEVPLESLNDVVEPYKDTLVKSRLDIYSKDGTVYGFMGNV